MALIKCSNCGSEISDKALQCPKCGVTIVEDNSEQIEKACVKCEECGTEIVEGEEACSNCGCPVPVADISAEQNSPQKVEVTAVNLSPMKKKHKKKYCYCGGSYSLNCCVVLCGIKHAKAE